MLTVPLDDMHGHAGFSKAELFYVSIMQHLKQQNALPDLTSWNEETHERTDGLMQHLKQHNALPDLTNWNRETHERIDVSRMQQVLQCYFADLAIPAELSPKDLSMLSRILLWVYYFNPIYKSLSTPSLPDNLLEIILHKYSVMHIIIPDIAGVGVKQLNVEDLMPVHIAAMLLHSAHIDTIFRNIRRFSHYVVCAGAKNKSDYDDHLGARGCGITTLQSYVTYALQCLVSPAAEILQQLPPALELPSAPLNWKTLVLEKLASLRRLHNPANGFLFAYELSPDRIGEYIELQREIAELIPIEYMRPTIIIRIRSSNRHKTDPLDLGLLGGMDTFTDSRIMQQLFSGPHGKNANSLLVSCPPVGKHEKMKYPGGHAEHSAVHMHCLRYLSSANCQKIAFLSGAAHIHTDEFNWVTGDLSRMLLGLSNKKFIHLVAAVASQLNTQLQNSNPKSVLILGTTEEALENVYFTLLTPSNPIYPFRTTHIDLGNVPAEQATLQEYIDAAKTPHLAQQVASEFYNTLLQWIGKRKPTHVLLGSYKLSILLNCTLPSGATVKDALLESLKPDLLIFLDAEIEMSNILQQEKSAFEEKSPFCCITRKLEKIKGGLPTGEVKGSDLARRNVITVLEQALNSNDIAAAISSINSVTAGNSTYLNVTTHFFGEQSSRSFLGTCAYFAGTTTKEAGQLIGALVPEVLAYLESKQQAEALPRVGAVSSAPK